MTRVLIAGYYGHGNLGDEAILGATLDEFRRLLPELAATVVSGDPAGTRLTYGVDSVHERDLPGLVAAVHQADLIIVGGGGLFHDYWGMDEATLLARVHWGLTFVAAFPAIATLVGRPFMILAAGVGPLTSDAGKKYTRLIFERADVATVRDDASLQLLQEIGVDVSRVNVTADPAFLLTAGSRTDLVPNAGDSGDRARTICVVLRQWDVGIDQSIWQQAVAGALDRFVAEHDADVLFVPFQTAGEDERTNDHQAIEAVRRLMAQAKRTTVVVDLDARQAQQAIRESDLVLSMRLHGVILAANAGVPVVALAYDPKVAGVMTQLGLADNVIPLNEAEADRIAGRLSASWSRRQQIRVALDDAQRRLAEAARQNIVLAVETIRAGRRDAAPASDEWNQTLRHALLGRVHRAEAMETYAAELTALVRTKERALEEAAAQADKQKEAAARELERAKAATLALGQRLIDVQSELAARPGAAARRRRRQLRTTMRDALRTPLKITRTVAAAPFRLVGLAVEATVPESVRRAVGRAASTGLMSWPAYVFDLYRRARAALFARDFSRLMAPGQADLVSIVLPAYNGASMIRQSVDSVLAQTYANFELIIVDDGSTDETPQIADDYARQDPRVRVVHQPNAKLPRALSRGFSMARGEFLSWTSCDNRMRPEFLEKMVASLRRHPGWDMAYANLDLIGEDGRPLRNATYWHDRQRPARSEHVYLPESPAELNVVANNSVGAAFLYRSRVAQLIGDYSAHRFVMEDYDYWMRVNALMTLRHADFDEPIYEYRFHRKSLTSRWEELGMLRHRDRLMVFDDFRRDFYRYPLLWVIDGDQADLATRIAAKARAAGHLVYDGSFPLTGLPGLWVPVVYVRATDWPEMAVPIPSELPASTLRVIATSAPSLPAVIPDPWQLCLSIDGPSNPPRLSGSRGWLTSADLDTLLLAADVRARSRHLEAIEALIEAPPSPTVRASIVICAMEAGERLFAAVSSAARQRMPHAEYEVIVVNNDPTRTAMDGMLRRCAELFADQPDHLRLVLCPIPGLSAARNAAIAEARGGIVCFIDDDAIADEQWLPQLCAAFDEHPEAGVIGGHIALDIPEPRPEALQAGWEKYWSQYLTGFTEYTEVDDWRGFPWGANWSARRSVLLQIGGFRREYGRVGENFWGGEELVAARLVQRLGFRIAVLPQAVVRHAVDPRRFTLDHVRQTILAGHHVGRLAQRDMYLPRADGAAPLVAPIVTTHFDRSVPAGRYRWLDALYRKRAQISAARAEYRDIRRRGRTPIVGGR